MELKSLSKTALYKRWERLKTKLRNILGTYLEEKDFEELKELFAQEMVLPEKRKDLDKIVLGGIYALMAEMEFINKNNIEAFKYLYSAIENLEKEIISAYDNLGNWLGESEINSTGNYEISLPFSQLEIKSI